MNMTPATHSGQRSGNISSITPRSMMTSGSSGHFLPDMNMTPATHSGHVQGTFRP
jgi:hypothetical protein